MTLAEQIARIIDPESWAVYDRYAALYPGTSNEVVAPSLAKAEQAIAIVCEEAAKVAEDNADRTVSKPYERACRNIASEIRKRGSAS